MSQIAINTSQNVNINFNLASVGERIAASAIDFIIKIAYYLLINLIIYKILNLGAVLAFDDYWSNRAVEIIIALPIIFYTLACESLMEGQTFGKKVMNIKVVKIDGYQAGFGDYFIRWIFRIIDLGTAIIGLVTMIISKNNQRWGGMASGTAVIQLKNKVNISHTILENLSEVYNPTFPQVIAFSDNDMRIIKDNYQKAMRINDQQLVNKLTTKILDTLRLDPDQIDMTAPQFIDKVIKDYNFYTGNDQ